MKWQGPRGHLGGVGRLERENHPLPGFPSGDKPDSNFSLTPFYKPSLLGKSGAFSFTLSLRPSPRGENLCVSVGWGGASLEQVRECRKDTGSHPGKPPCEPFEFNVYFPTGDQKRSQQGDEIERAAQVWKLWAASAVSHRSPSGAPRGHARGAVDSSHPRGAGGAARADCAPHALRGEPASRCEWGQSAQHSGGGKVGSRL